MSFMPTPAPKIVELMQAKDPKSALLKAVGDLSKIDVMSDLVLVGTFIRNEMINGILRPDVQEDENQGKAGLVLKLGPYAYGDWEDDADRGQNAQIGTWVVFQLKDGWQMQINGTPCRLVAYQRLRLRIADPNLLF